MAVPFQDGLSQFFDDSGNPLSGGLVYSYRAGTTTPIATYTTRAGTVEHDNPVTLDSAGRASIWLDRSTAYRFDIKSADDVLIDSVDNVILTDGSSPAYQVETFTATEGQTVINLAGTYTQGVNAISVYVGDGGALYLSSGTDYTETSESSITLAQPLAEGETVTVIFGPTVSFSSGAIADASEVSYTPSGGSLTNVKARLDRVLYVQDYGTDTAAFQAAINALPAAGGTIDGSSGTYTGIGALTFGSKRIHWQNFRSVNGLETSDVLPGNQTRVGPAIANGRGFMVSPDLIISAFSDANAILPALFLTKDSTAGYDGQGLAKIQWRGTSEEGSKNVDGGRFDSVIIDATRATYTVRMGVHPHVDGNDESQPAMAWQDGVTVPAKDALADIAITSGGTGYIVGDDLTITSADGTGAEALVTKAAGGIVSRVSVQTNGYGFVNGESLTITGGTGTGLAGTAIVPSNMFMYGHGTLNVARKLLLNNTVVGEYDYINDRTQANFDVIEVQDDADPAAFSDALGNGIVNVGASYYVRNIPTWQYNAASGKVRQNRDFGHRGVSVAAADSPYTMDGLPEVLLISAAAGNVTVTLPAANFFGAGYASRVLIRRTDSTSNTVTIQRAGSDTVNGGTSVTLAGLQSFTLFSNGSTAWYTFASGNTIDVIGAVGDGVTDDSAAIQAALDAANTMNGGIVQLPAGVFVAENLVIYSNTTLKGAAKSSGTTTDVDGTVLLLKASSANPLIQSYAYSANQTTADAAIVLENMTLHGNRYNSGTGEIVVFATRHSLIRECRVAFGGTNGVTFTSVTKNGVTEVDYAGVNTIESSTIVRNKRHGIYGNDGPSFTLADMIIRGCSVGLNGDESSSYWNIYIERAAGLQVTQNNIYWGFYGNLYAAAGEGTITGNIFHDDPATTSGTYSSVELRAASSGSFAVSGNDFWSVLGSAVGGVTYVFLTLGAGGVDCAYAVSGNTFHSSTVAFSVISGAGGSDDTLSIVGNAVGKNCTLTIPANTTLGLDEFGIYSTCSDASTRSNNFHLRPSAANTAIYSGVAPSGTGTFAQWAIYSTGDVNNAGYLRLESSNASYAAIGTSVTGTGTAIPLRVQLAGGQLGFYGSNGATKQTITGSRGGNAALADLLTKLASLGLITDSTSA